MRVFLCDFIHNNVPGGNVLSESSDFTVPLNIGGIGAYALQAYEGELDLRLFKYADRLLAALDESPPSVVGMSTYAWNTHINMEITRYIKAHYPDTLVVMGGPAIRTDDEGIKSFLQHHNLIDGYVLFEGERAFVDILHHVAEHGPDLSVGDATISNLARLDGDTLVYQRVERFPGLDDMPSPYLSGLMDEFLADGLMPMFETNRGCPFACTFCTWGISSLNKVRRFPLERVFDEINYVADKFPNFPAWIIADANFGIHKRDVEIAREIKQVKDRCPALEVIVTWDSKNTFDRNEEIATILDRFVGAERRATSANRAYMALQHLSPHVLKNIKRDNIKLGDLPERVGRFHNSGLEVTTDIIYGLPGESWDDAIASLSTAFDVEFDFINFLRALMLPGSEMEEEQSRVKYGLKSKFAVRRGSYGEYDAKHEKIRALEFDEIVSSSSTMTEDEMLSLTVLQWLIFYFWNLGRGSALLRAVHKEFDINPTTILCGVLDVDAKQYPLVANHITNLRKDLSSIIFESPEAMREHYFQEENWQTLRSYVRVELRYNSLAFLDGELHRQFFDVFDEIIGRSISNEVISDILDVSRENFIDPHAIVAGDSPAPKIFTVSSMAAGYLTRERTVSAGASETSTVVLDKQEESVDEARRILKNWDFTSGPVGAVERLVGPKPGLISFDISADRVNLEMAQS